MRYLVLSLLTSLVLTTTVYAQSITLDIAWDIPTTNLDGSPLTDLDGFLVCADTLPIPDASIPGCGAAERFVIIDETANFFVVDWSVLTYSGTVYIRMKAFDTTGNESPWSEELSAPFAVTQLPDGSGGPGPSAPVIRWR